MCTPGKHRWCQLLMFSCCQYQYVQDWCWCGSVLTALLPATCSNSAFLLPLLQVVSISGQPWRAYYKFPGPEPRSAGGVSLSRDHLCGTVYGDQRWLHTFKRQLKAYLFHIWCTGKQKEHSPPPGAVVWRFRDSGPGYKTADLLTSAINCVVRLVFEMTCDMSSRTYNITNSTPLILLISACRMFVTNSYVEFSVKQKLLSLGKLFWTKNQRGYTENIWDFVICRLNFCCHYAVIIELLFWCRAVVENQLDQTSIIVRRLTV